VPIVCSRSPIGASSETVASRRRLRHHRQRFRAWLIAIRYSQVFRSASPRNFAIAWKLAKTFPASGREPLQDRWSGDKQRVYVAGSFRDQLLERCGLAALQSFKEQVFRFFKEQVFGSRTDTD